MRRGFTDLPACSGVIAVCAVLVGLGAAVTAGQTIIYSRGQNVAPAFEGWERNPDGTISLWFGYMNRNMDEKLHIPVGPHNRLEPGPADAGQPTWFQPRRNRYVFRVTVPADFGAGEVVWTLTAHGRTESACGSLRVNYIVDDLMKMMDIGGLGVTEVERGNQAPTVRVEGAARRRVRPGETLRLTALASDDGIPEPKAARSLWPGLATPTYPDYRGDSPWTPGWAPPPLPADGRYPVTATFTAPGTYVLRVMAHDGGFISTADVTVTVVQE